MKILGFDIETIPNQSIPEECKPQFDKDSVKVGNLKDPAKISDKLIEAETAFNESITKTMSIDPSLAQICTFVGIEYDTDKDKVISEHCYQVTEEIEHDDYDAVFHGWELIVKAYLGRTPVVSYNGKSFDLPIMFMRAIQQDVAVVPNYYEVLTNRYTTPKHYDIFQILSGGDRNRWKKLDFYLKLFGIGDKGGMDGSQVWPAYQAGEYQKITDYCRNDVISTCKLFTRIAPWFVKEED